MKLAGSFRANVAQTSNSPVGLEIDTARGSWLYTSDGKRYLDFTSGIGVNSIGMLNPRVNAMIKDQLEKYAHTTVYGEHIQTPQVEYAEQILERSHREDSQVFFVNSGSEANDLALKTSRKFTGKPGVVALTGAFHGRGYGPMELTYNKTYRAGFFVRDGQTTWIEPTINAFRGLEETGELDEVGTVFLELVQGEAGCVPLDYDFVQYVRDETRRRGITLVVDEVQTGYGRTGQFLAQQTYGIEADIFTLGKTGGGGLPFGAVVAHRDYFERLQTPMLSHLTTFGGNPVVCAAGLGVMHFMKESLYKKVRDRSSQLRQGLEELAIQYPMVFGGPRGRGLMMGTFVANGRAVEVTEKARELGLIVAMKLNNPNFLRLTLQLDMSDEDFEHGMGLLRQVGEELS